MEPEQSINEKLDVQVNQVEPVKPAKNPKRVAAGKKLVENNKKAKEKMLEIIAEANANASKANENANDAKNTLKNYLEQRSAKPNLQEYQTPIVISGALLLAGLYLWSSKRVTAPTPHEASEAPPLQRVEPQRSAGSYSNPTQY